MNPRASLWLKTVYARTWVRTKSIYGEPLWVAVNVGFPFFTSLALSLLYSSAGLKAGIGFAFLGGVMVSFWGNVLWSMASQFNWDKQQGLFELYVTSPAPISAILIGMSLGGILGTAPSAMTLAIIGWLLFAPPATPLWPLVALTFALTLASLYAMGMALSSLYLVYGREADSVNEALHEPVSFLSGVYFPSSLAFPAALQAVVLIIPLAVGMDALQRTLFSLNSTGATDLTPVYRDLGLLAIMGITLLFAASKALKILEEKGRRAGTIAVRQK
ncbi:MAG TPA: ABC transporter permease [Candidatus Bathyarchaeia archaeon]|nr:ABC transporter permease [Candidatus Dormibacteraeota bacterium]HYU87171.1 ABC transporter permease [Candidatus Bathyarchaeia archaeon]